MFKPHILINGLSMGGGGGLTVGRELWRHLALDRSGWRFTMALVQGHPLHEQMRSAAAPNNAQLHWAPPATAGRVPRARYERRGLVEWANANAVDAVLQLNGMVVPALGRPTLAHFQDPLPYRPEAWGRWQDRFVAFLKRREHVRALKQAAAVGFTSAYLRDLITGRLGIHPRLCGVYYNGVPQEWIDRAESMPPWENRPMELITVSNVSPYKRQALVIRALARLVRMPGLSELRYRIVGECEQDYQAVLRALASELGIGDRVILEGRISDQRMLELLSTARCSVMMSVCESFGIPAIEAMTRGTPAIVADCCALPEVCADAAVLAPADDLDALVGLIAQLLNDPSRVEVLRRRGAERVRQFTWTSTAAAMALTLEHIISPSHAGA